MAGRHRCLHPVVRPSRCSRQHRAAPRRPDSKALSPVTLPGGFFFYSMSVASYNSLGKNIIYFCSCLLI